MALPRPAARQRSLAEGTPPPEGMARPPWRRVGASVALCALLLALKDASPGLSAVHGGAHDYGPTAPLRATTPSKTYTELRDTIIGRVRGLGWAEEGVGGRLAREPWRLPP